MWFEWLKGWGLSNYFASSFYRFQTILGCSKFWYTFCASPTKHFVLCQKMISIQCQHKYFLRGTECNQIFRLAQKIGAGTKHFGTCRKTRHKLINCSVSSSNQSKNNFMFALCTKLVNQQRITIKFWLITWSSHIFTNPESTNLQKSHEIDFVYLFLMIGAQIEYCYLHWHHIRINKQIQFHEKNCRLIHSFKIGETIWWAHHKYCKCK